MKPPIRVFFVIFWVAYGNVFFKRDLEITADGTCTSSSLTNYCRMETVNVASENECHDDQVSDCMGNVDCFGVYLDTSGSTPICMQLIGCPSIVDSQQTFYLAPMMKSNLQTPSAQQSVWVKIPGTTTNKLKLPFTDEYNLHPMSSYTLSSHCKKSSTEDNGVDRYILGNDVGFVANKNYHCPVDGEGLFAYAVFSVTSECDISTTTNPDIKIELRMWEKSATTVTGGDFDAMKSVKITGASSKFKYQPGSSASEFNQMLVFDLDNDIHQHFFENPGAFSVTIAGCKADDGTNKIKELEAFYIRSNLEIKKICNSYHETKADDSLAYYVWDTGTWENVVSDAYKADPGFYYERIFHEEDFAIDECPEITIPAHHMTFKQMTKEEDSFNECNNDGLCLAIIQMSSNFQTVSLTLPQNSNPGDVPFIFSGIDDFIEYIENGLTSSSSIFLQFPAEFDHSDPEHMVLFKRIKQKNLCSAADSCTNFQGSMTSSNNKLFYIDETQRPSSEIFSNDDTHCRHLCKSNSKCFGLLLRYWDTFLRCAFYVQGVPFQLSLHSTTKFYNYGREYTNQDFHYKSVEFTCGTNSPMITSIEAHDLDDENYIYTYPAESLTIGKLDYLDELECKAMCTLMGDACLAFSHRSFKDITIGSKTISTFQGNTQNFENSKTICNAFDRTLPIPTSAVENDDWYEFLRWNHRFFLGAELGSTTDIYDWRVIGTEDPIAFTCYENEKGCWASGQPDGDPASTAETALEMTSNGKWNNLSPSHTRPLVCQKEVTRVYGPPRNDLKCGNLYDADCPSDFPYCKDADKICSDNADGTNANDFSSKNVENGIFGCHLSLDATVNFDVIEDLGWKTINENQVEVAGWSTDKGSLPGIDNKISDELKKEDGLRICNWPTYINETVGMSIHFSAVFNRHRDPDITNGYCDTTNGNYVAKETLTAPIVKCILHITDTNKAESTYIDFYSRTSDLPAFLDRLEYRYFVKQASHTGKYQTLEQFGLDYEARDDTDFASANIQYCENICLHETNCAGFTTQTQTEPLCWALGKNREKLQLINILPLSDTVVEKSKTMEIKLCGDTDECVLTVDDHWAGPNCQTNSHCVNTIGSYNCDCDAGYEKAGTGTFDACNNINECDTTNGKKHDCDDNVSDCLDNDGSYTCVCKNGFKRDPNNDKGCIDIDECSEQMPDSTDFYPCNSNAMCVNTVGSYKCSCNLGYYGNELNDDPSNVCHDYDECQVDRKVWSMENAHCPIGEPVHFEVVKQKCLNMGKVALTVRTPEQRDAYFEMV